MVAAGAPMTPFIGALKEGGTAAPNTEAVTKDNMILRSCFAHDSNEFSGKQHNRTNTTTSFRVRVHLTSGDNWSGSPNATRWQCRYLR